MALYQTEITVPPNTPVDNPTETTITIDKKVVTRIEIQTRPGQFSQAGVSIFYGIEQISPETKGQWHKGDGEIIVDNINWVAPEVPCTLTIKGFNNCELFEHTFIIRIEAQDYLIAFPWKVMKDFIDLIGKLIGV